MRIPAALQAVIDAGTAVARSARSTRMALAHVGAAVDPAVLPRHFRAELGAELAAAHAAVEPMPAREVEKALKAAWGRPAGKVLDDLDLDSPLTVAAASQRHLGELDGERVEIEVQRPGLASAVRGDLVLLDALASPLGAAFGALDTGALLREIRETALDELDLEHAAGLQRQVARALRDVDDVVVPRPISELAAPTVLVQEHVEGPTLAEPGQGGGGAGAGRLDAGERAAVARALVRAHVVAARDAGLALMDPHPADIVLLPGGRIGLRRAGIAAPVDRGRVGLVLDALHALADADPDAFAAAVVAAGVLDRDAASSAYELALAGLGPLVGAGVRLDAAVLAAAGERALGLLGELMPLAARGRLSRGDPALARTAGLLLAALARLEHTDDWVALTR